jgi:hypothetical protein
MTRRDGPRRLPPALPLRRRTLAALLPAMAILGACATGEPPPQPPPPPDFAFLTRLRLDVAEVLVDDRLPPSPPADRGARAAVSPADYLRAIARDRLLADGTSGRAVATLQRAEVIETRVPTRGALFTTEIDTRYEGRMAMRVELIGADGTPSGFAEADVRRSREVLENADQAARAAVVQAIARDLADAMNVELEFQLRRSLRDAFVDQRRPAMPDAVEQEPLTTPRR